MIVRTSIALPFIGRIDAVFSFFSKGIVLLDVVLCSHIVASWRHNFREIALEKVSKSPKIGGKGCAHNFL